MMGAVTNTATYVDKEDFVKAIAFSSVTNIYAGNTWPFEDVQR